MVHPALSRRAPLEAAGRTCVIAPESNRKEPRPFDKEIYNARHLIENFYCSPKRFRAIATRYDKTAAKFLAAIYLAAAITRLN